MPWASIATFAADILKDVLIAFLAFRVGAWKTRTYIAELAERRTREAMDRVSEPIDPGSVLDELS